MNQRRLLMFLMIFGGVACVIAVIYFGFKGQQHSLVVSSSVVPVKLEVADEVFEMNEKTKSVVVPHGSHRYRATATLDGNMIVLAGTVNTYEEKDTKLVLNFSLYSDSEIKKVLCEDAQKPCIFNTAEIKTTYLEGYQWAVSSINIANLGQSTAVLRVVDGRWTVEDGPATDISASGYFPQSVKEAVANNE